VFAEAVQSFGSEYGETNFVASGILLVAARGGGFIIGA